jgi:hypothetical protein
MKFLETLIPIFLMLIPMALVSAYIVLSKKKLASFRKNPINMDLLRSPGESLREQIEDKKLDIDAYLTIIPVLPLLLYISYLQSSKSIFYSLVLSCSGVICIVIATYKLKNLIKIKTKLSLGYDAELSIGQELNTLMRDGYYVFHDIPAENYNIDHVVVGATGVFAVETKGRSKPIKKDGTSEFKVKYDGKQLNFPNWVETQPLEQAKRQANSLQKWLSNAVGEAVEVKPILAIPGWYIERTGNQGIIVINGKNPLSIFGKSNGSELNEKLIIQVAHQLDQRCRTVKPKAK